MRKNINILILVLTVLFGLKADSQDNQPRLNIWVHGTTIRASVPIKFSKFHNSTKLMHYSELIFNQGACPRAEILAKNDPVNFPLDSFYLFRWSGLLNRKEREVVSCDLYKYLISKVDEILQKTGKYPIITIITHSHGGNIALYLAKINEKFDSKLKIARLILLACPVQYGTAQLVNDKTFDQIYAFYSTYDIIQIMALQPFGRPSLRKFSKFSNKVVHVKTAWKKRGLWHNEFKGLSFLTKIGDALKQIEQTIAQPTWNINQDYDLIVS